MDDSNNVVRLFFSEADLENAWKRFDCAMIALRDAYEPPLASEIDRRAAAVEAAAAEDAFKKVWQRFPGSKLLAAS